LRATQTWSRITPERRGNFPLHLYKSLGVNPIWVTKGTKFCSKSQNLRVLAARMYLLCKHSLGVIPTGYHRISVDTYPVFLRACSSRLDELYLPAMARSLAQPPSEDHGPEDLPYEEPPDIDDYLKRLESLDSDTDIFDY